MVRWDDELIAGLRGKSTWVSPSTRLNSTSAHAEIAAKDVVETRKSAARNASTSTIGRQRASAKVRIRLELS
jgi:hypothetical protein